MGMLQTLGTIIRQLTGRRQCGAARRERLQAEDDALTRCVTDIMATTPDLAAALRARERDGREDHGDERDVSCFIHLLERLTHGGNGWDELSAIVDALRDFERRGCFWSIANEVLSTHPDPSVRWACARELHNRVVDEYLLDDMTFEERQRKASLIIQGAIARESSSSAAPLKMVLRDVVTARAPTSAAPAVVPPSPGEPRAVASSFEHRPQTASVLERRSFSNRQELDAFLHTECKFLAYMPEGMQVFGLDRKDNGRMYEVYRADCLATAMRFLRSLPREDIPPRYYVIVETPEGNVGRDLEVIFNEATGDTIEA
jgi:hypothetical protein